MPGRCTSNRNVAVLQDVFDREHVIVSMPGKVRGAPSRTDPVFKGTSQVAGSLAAPDWCHGEGGPRIRILSHSKKEIVEQANACIKYIEAVAARRHNPVMLKGYVAELRSFLEDEVANVTAPEDVRNI